MSVPYLDVRRQDRCFDEELDTSIMQLVCPQGFRVTTSTLDSISPGKAHGFSGSPRRAAPTVLRSERAPRRSESWGSTLERTARDSADERSRGARDVDEFSTEYYRKASTPR